MNMMKSDSKKNQKVKVTLQLSKDFMTRLALDIWQELDTAARGQPPYSGIRMTKRKIVEEALRTYLPTLRTLKAEEEK